MTDDGRRREDHSNKFYLLDMKFSNRTTQSSVSPTAPTDDNDHIILIAVGIVIALIIAAMVGGILRAWTLERRAVQSALTEEPVEIELQPLQHVVEEVEVVCDSRLPMVLGPRSIRDRKHFAKIPHTNFTLMARPKVHHRKNRLLKKE